MLGKIKGTKMGESKYAELCDPELLRQWYEDEKISKEEIGRKVGCHSRLVENAFRRYDIPLRTAQSHRDRGSKYPELNDEEWLRQKFVDEGLSRHAISKLIGGGHNLITSVKYALERFDIIAKTPRGGKSSDFSELNDRDTLFDLYVVQGLSMNRIAEIIGAKSQNTVKLALVRFEIPCRDVREAQIVGRDDDHFVIDRSVIDGCLLGDAWLWMDNWESDFAAPSFGKTNADINHVRFVAGLLFSEDSAKRIVKRSRLEFNKDGIPIVGYEMKSLSHDELTPIYREWYRGQPGSKRPVKVVPPSVLLNSVSLLHWYMDDGCCSWMPYSSGITEMRLCSMGFTKEDQEMLVDLVNQKFDVGLCVKKGGKGSGYHIEIGAYKHNDFLDLIGPCPVPSMAYKWKYDMRHYSWVSPNFTPLRRYRRVDQDLENSRFPGTLCTLPDRVICPWSIDMDSPTPDLMCRSMAKWRPLAGGFPRPLSPALRATLAAKRPDKGPFQAS